MLAMHNLSSSMHTVWMQQREAMQKEVKYLLDNGPAKPSYSPWSSPCLVTPKSDGSPWFCPDFHKVIAVTASDFFLLPHIFDFGAADFVSKLDLLKGYWQVPLTQSIWHLCYCYSWSLLRIHCYALWNEKCTFQRLMSTLLQVVSNCNVYLDDLIIYSSSWSQHIGSLQEVFNCLEAAALMLNLAKCEFASHRSAPSMLIGNCYYYLYCAFAWVFTDGWLLQMFL